jgi:hypothetical protein
MSKIVAFRDRVCETIAAAAPELRDVEWYDGLFDEHDISDWSLNTPCARVAVMTTTTQHEMTGEMNACLRVVVVIIDQDGQRQRDADARAWELVERVAVLANLNQFGDPDAAPATKVKFSRLSQPELRREGVSIGVVEWESDLTIGNNRSKAREFIYYNGQQVTQLPRSNVTGRGHGHNAAGMENDEVVDLTPEE